MDQNPIGKSSRSNAVTYLKVYDDIRKLLSDQQYAKLNGYTPSHFSFNLDGGRCPECQGEGFVKIGMQFMADVSMVCEACGGRRFKPDILEVRYKGVNIDDILNMSVEEAISFFGSQDDPTARRIAERLQPLIDVGLSYIKLGQSSSTLSGGESQRIRLATQIGSKLVNVLYILDEPSIGLHQRDNDKLLATLKRLRDLGNTLIVVEHDEETMMESDYLVDIGPRAGVHGGEIVVAGTPEEVMQCEQSITGAYLSKRKKIDLPASRRTGSGKFINIVGASENNLNNVNVKFPLGLITCVTGVSGSGKSSLVNEVLYKNAYIKLYSWLFEFLLTFS